MYFLRQNIIPTPNRRTPQPITALMAQDTIDAIVNRQEQYTQGNETGVRVAAKQVTRTSRQEKRRRLNQRIADGSWDTTKTVRKKYQASPECLRTPDGQDVAAVRHRGSARFGVPGEATGAARRRNGTHAPSRTCSVL